MEFKHGDGVKLYQNERGQMRLRIQNVGHVKIKYHTKKEISAIMPMRHNWFV
jgi:hypothetical protein